MPGRRPTPLSDELFIPECSAPAPMLLGATNNGMPLPVKNTFLDVPSGLTPTSLKNEWCKPLLTAPAGMSKPLAFPVQAATNPAPGLNVEKTPARPGALQPYTGTPPATPATGAAVLTPTRVLLIQAPGAVATTPGTESEAVAPGASVPAALARTPQRLQVMGVSVAATTPSHTSVRSAPSLPEPPASPGRVLASSWSPPQQPAGQTLARQLFEQPLQEVAGAEDPDESDSDSDDDEVVPQHLRQVESAPKPPPGALHPSVGSRTHMSGLCKRCCFFPRGRCANGYECEFCHYEHDKRKRKNKKKRTIRARQGFGNGTTRLLLAKELMRSSASRPDYGAGRQVITVPAAAMERRHGAPMSTASCMQQAPVLLQAAGAGGATAFQQPGGAAQQLAWLTAAPGQQFVGYCQAADAAVPRAQLAAAGMQPLAGQQQVLVYGGGPQQLAAAQLYGTTAPAVGTACAFGPTDSLQVVVHNPQQPASHMIMLPPAMSQAAAQGPGVSPMQRFCEPPPPPMQSPRLQRILGPPPPGMAMAGMAAQR
mmetsp:Transcript_152028/g.369177  ORF Transcript_152028/g.369177 Transcript_152028/m.369177 type:complete len:539 (+) Transcript_152028:104-1720(+)